MENYETIIIQKITNNLKLTPEEVKILMEEAITCKEYVRSDIMLSDKCVGCFLYNDKWYYIYWYESNLRDTSGFMYPSQIATILNHNELINHSNVIIVY